LRWDLADKLIRQHADDPFEHQRWMIAIEEDGNPLRPGWHEETLQPAVFLERRERIRRYIEKTNQNNKNEPKH
jgi:hypothetical protein